MQGLKQKLANYPYLYRPLRRAKQAVFSSPPPVKKAPKMLKIPLPTFTVVEVGRLLYYKRLLDLVSDIEGDVVE